MVFDWIRVYRVNVSVWAWVWVWLLCERDCERDCCVSVTVVWACLCECECDCACDCERDCCVSVSVSVTVVWAWLSVRAWLWALSWPNDELHLHVSTHQHIQHFLKVWVDRMIYLVWGYDWMVWDWVWMVWLWVNGMTVGVSIVVMCWWFASAIPIVLQVWKVMLFCYCFQINYGWWLLLLSYDWL